MIRKAGLGYFSTEVQVAYATDERIKKFHQQRVSFMVLPRSLTFTADVGAQPSSDGAIKVLKHSPMSHEEWAKNMGLQNWTNYTQWFVRGFYWSYTNTLFFYHGPECSFYEGCMKYMMMADNMRAVIETVGGNQDTVICAGMKLGVPGTVWQPIRVLGPVKEFLK